MVFHVTHPLLPSCEINVAKRSAIHQASVWPSLRRTLACSVRRYRATIRFVVSDSSATPQQFYQASAEEGGRLANSLTSQADVTYQPGATAVEQTGWLTVFLGA